MGRLSADLVLLSIDPTACGFLRRMLQTRASVVRVELVEGKGPLASAIAEARAAHGVLPIAVATRTREEAIVAIEAGADDAMVVHEDDKGALTELIDRARLRGSQRAASERERAEVAQAEKLAALGTLVAGVAHEVNNPLGALVLLVDLIPTQVAAAADLTDELKRLAARGEDLPAAEVARMAAVGSLLGSRAELTAQVEGMNSAVNTIAAVVKDLRVFARGGDDERAEVVDLHELLDHLLRLVGKEIESLAIIERDFESDLPQILVPHGRLTQVLTNVLINATHAMREVRRDVHRLRLMTRADEATIALMISDTGPGIAPEAVERIFDPFYTTKRGNLGTGLGLSISRNLMRKMGGDLLVESVHGEGATFVVLVPRPTAEDVLAATVRARMVPAPRNPAERLSLMVVSEYDHLARAYARVLGRRYDIVVAMDAREASELVASGSRVDALLVDVPARDAAWLQNWLLSHRPDLAGRVVFVADDPGALLEGKHSKLANKVLPKPPQTATLIRAIDDAVSRA